MPLTHAGLASVLLLMANPLGHEAFELVDDGGQAVHRSLSSEELAMSPRRMTAHRGARWDITEHRTLGRDPGPVSDDEVIGHSDVSRENDIVPDPSAARDAHPSHDQAALTDVNVVTDMNQVVQLGTSADSGIIDAAAIDGG